MELCDAICEIECSNKRRRSLPVKDQINLERKMLEILSFKPRDAHGHCPGRDRVHSYFNPYATALILSFFEIMNCSAMRTHFS